MPQDHSTIPEMVDNVRAGKVPRRTFIKTLTTMGISVAGVGAIAAVASLPSASTLVDQHAVEETESKHTQLHDQHLSHQGNGNASALHHDYAPNAIVEDSMHPHAFVGQRAIMARKNIVLAAASDPNITITNRIVSGNQVTAEWIATGIHTGDLPGLPASGRPFTIRGVTVVIRENDKIVREALYFDVAELRRQLG